MRILILADALLGGFIAAGCAVPQGARWHAHGTM
jgi:hypothetical protein